MVVRTSSLHRRATAVVAQRSEAFTDVQLPKLAQHRACIRWVRRRDRP